jgi:hypothetical protein
VKKDSLQKLLIICMFISYGLAVGTTINGIFAFLLNKNEGNDVLRVFIIALCFAWPAAFSEWQ